VAAIRLTAAATLLPKLSRSTKIVAITAHMPPSRSSARDAEYTRDRALVTSQ
jgi:hypothetical protein